MPKVKTSKKLVSIFIIFTVTEIIIGQNVDCIPINQPDIAIVPSNAGVPETHILK
jgi:hypothetical protein